MKAKPIFMLLAAIWLSITFSLAQPGNNSNPYAIFGSEPYIAGSEQEKEVVKVLVIENLAEGSVVARLEHNIETGIVTFFDLDGAIIGKKKLKTGERGWGVIDPKAGNHYNLSPYAYTANNPIIYIDPNGEDYYLSLHSGQVFYFEGTHDLFDHGYVNILEGSGASFGDIEDALTSRGYGFSYVKEGESPMRLQVDTEAAYKGWTMMQVFSPDAVSTFAGLGMMGMGQVSATARGLSGASGVANAGTKGGTALWPAADGGRTVINGIEYTTHALQRMQPVATGGRGIPPSVVQNAIKYGSVSPGNTAGEVVRTFQNVRVITNQQGTRVISVIKIGQ